MSPKEVLLNTKGVAAQLNCSENWVQKLAQRGRLKAYVYSDGGVLVEREPDMPRQGQGMLFYQKDIDAFMRKQRRGRGRPRTKQSTKKVERPAA